MNKNDELPRRKRILILGAVRGRFGLTASTPDADGGEGLWIDDFCNRPDLEFRKVPYQSGEESWHKRGATTPLTDWVGHFKYVHQSMKWRADCIVTLFPQRALAAAALLPFTGRPDTRLVAWHFNLGSLSGGLKRHFAGRVLGRVDRFVVHARGEIASYARWLGIEEEKFRFAPLQK